MNPDRVYIEEHLNQPYPSAVDNDANSPFDRTTILGALEPGDKASALGKALIPAGACELADRIEFSNFSVQLDKVLIQR